MPPCIRILILSITFCSAVGLPADCNSSEPAAAVESRPAPRPQATKERFADAEAICEPGRRANMQFVGAAGVA